MKVVCVQEDVVFANPAANTQCLIDHLQAQGDLFVFPECFLTGYVFPDEAAARDSAIEIELAEDGLLTTADPHLLRIANECRQTGAHVVVGFAAILQGNLANVAALIEPSGRMRAYIKTHLPELAFDKMVVAGDALPVFETTLGRIGILICFDLRPPEAARTLAVLGADLICLPTNWPVGAEFSANQIAPVRAAENRVFLVCCDRAGDENGAEFIGLSGIYSPAGDALAKAGKETAVLTADIDISQAREKRMRPVPGIYEWTVMESRRPELYGPLTDA